MKYSKAEKLILYTDKFWARWDIKGKIKITSQKIKLCTYEDEVHDFERGNNVGLKCKKVIRVCITNSEFEKYIPCLWHAKMENNFIYF